MLTPQDMKIAEARAKGLSLSEIERTTGINDATAGRHLQRPDLRKYLERIQQQAIEDNAQATADNLSYLIQGYRKNQCKSEKERIEKSHGARMTERMAEGMGIFPSRVQSYVVNQLLSVNVTAHTQELERLAAFLRDQWSEKEEKVIEVSPGEDNG